MNHLCLMRPQGLPSPTPTPNPNPTPTHTSELSASIPLTQDSLISFLMLPQGKLN